MAPEWHYWSTPDHGPRALAFWRDAVCSGVLNSEFHAEPDAAFSGTMSSQTRAGARLVNFASSPHLIKRSQRQVSRLDSEHIMLSMQVQGRAEISQGDTQVLLEPGEFGLLDAGSAFDIHFPEPTARRLILLPRHVLAARAPGLRRLKAPQRLQADMAYAPVLTEAMRLLTDGALKLEDGMAGALLDTVAEIVALQCGQATAAIPSTELSFAQIKRHIDATVTDPALSPATASAACRISVRTLHRLFARHAQQSFEAYVVQARLALAHELLAAGRARTVSEAAFACGFNNLSHFTRRFSERYGELPVNLLRQTRP